MAMRAGLRLDPATIDLDGFRAFIDASGAVHDRLRASGSEVIRFRIGTAFGLVSRRQDGMLTFAGIAKPLVAKMLEGKPPRPAVKVAIRTVTLTAHGHAEARALLASATKAEVHTDGSCDHGGVGRGGWACIIRAGFVNVEMYGGARSTTVNRMEMSAAIAALLLLPPACAVRVMTDSQYLRKGIKQWIDGWKRNGWRTVAGTPVKNEDLWRKLDAAREGRQVKWKWVRGHSGDRHNERADELARKGRRSIDQQTGKAA